MNTFTDLFSVAVMAAHHSSKEENYCDRCLPTLERGSETIGVDHVQYVRYVKYDSS